MRRAARPETGTRGKLRVNPHFAPPRRWHTDLVVTAGPIDAYVASLRTALRGPRGAKTDLVTEARDSLTDAAARYEEDGLDRAAAERLAVDEFGSVAELTPDYQRELALAQGRRTAVLVGLAVSAQAVASELAWRRAATGWTWQPDRFYAILAHVVDYTGYAVVVAALLAALVCGIGSRYVDVGRAFVRATGIAAIGICVFFVVGGMALSLLSPAWHSAGTAMTPLSVATSMLTVALPVWMTYSGLRCVRVST
jgi:hypothetical protein